MLLPDLTCTTQIAKWALFPSLIVHLTCFVATFTVIQQCKRNSSATGFKEVGFRRNSNKNFVGQISQVEYTLDSIMHKLESNTSTFASPNSSRVGYLESSYRNKCCKKSRGSSMIWQDPGR